MPTWIEVLLFIKKRNRAAIKAKQFAAIAAFLFLQIFLNMTVFEVFRCLLLRGPRAKMARSLKMVALFDLFHRLPIREIFSSIHQKSQ